MYSVQSGYFCATSAQLSINMSNPFCGAYRPTAITRFALPSDTLFSGVIIGLGMTLKLVSSDQNPASSCVSNTTRFNCDRLRTNFLFNCAFNHFKRGFPLFSASAPYA